jgi:hypothetical protein
MSGSTAHLGREEETVKMGNVTKDLEKSNSSLNQE